MNYLKTVYKKYFGASPAPIQQPHSFDLVGQIEPEQLSQLFEIACKLINSSNTPLDDANKLSLYGLYKQATIGDCNTESPMMYNFVAMSKWSAWNNCKTMNKQQAMQEYIAVAIASQQGLIQQMKQLLLEPQADKKIANPAKRNEHMNENKGIKMVQQIDYSDSYNHPYFKKIVKGQDIVNIDHGLLLMMNDSPRCYPLHFAIDKERVEIVKKFVKELNKEEMEKMVDGQGIGVMEYAELIENEEIIRIVEQKMRGISCKQLKSNCE